MISDGLLFYLIPFLLNEEIQMKMIVENKTFQNHMCLIVLHNV